LNINGWSVSALSFGKRLTGIDAGSAKGVHLQFVRNCKEKAEIPEGGKENAVYPSYPSYPSSVLSVSREETPE
jgi:hypothetical protein